MIRWRWFPLPCQVAGTLRLATTTFTQQAEPQEKEEELVPVSDEFVSGAYELIEPFDVRKGTIQWTPDGAAAPSLSFYTWDGKLLAEYQCECSLPETKLTSCWFCPFSLLGRILKRFHVCGRHYTIKRQPPKGNSNFPP